MFNLFIYNTHAEIGPFALCVIYDEENYVPLIKEIVGEEVSKIYNYCISNNIKTIESNKLCQYECYTNFIKKPNGYFEVSGIYLNDFRDIIN
ncbi:MAG: hypothetical protein RBT24_08920 [Arcobacteraceae bacterium]|jgi:hypothetical protein|nr:hypothetical protein [Arcobacteraceae bacterium]